MDEREWNAAFRSGAWNEARTAASAAGAPVSLGPEDFDDLSVQGYDMRKIALGRGRYAALRLCECDLREAVIRGSHLSGLMVLKSLADGLSVKKARMWACTWSGTDLVGSRFEGVEMEMCGFVSCSLQDSVFEDCELVTHGLGLRGSDISGADLRGVKGLEYRSVAHAKWLETKPPLLPAALERRVTANRRHFKCIETAAGRYVYDARPAEKYGSHWRGS